MRLPAPVLLVCLLLIPAVAPSADEAQLAALLESEWQRRLSERPEFASRLGIPGHDHRWRDLSLRAVDAAHRADRNALRVLGRIDPARLERQAAIDHELLRRDLEQRIALHRHGQHLLAIEPLESLLWLDRLADEIEFSRVEDFEHWLARLESVDGYIGEVIELLRTGSRRGIVAPRAVIRRLPPGLRVLLVEDARESGFYRPFLDIPPQVHPARAEALRRAAQSAIGGRVLPAYRRLHDFLVEEYLPLTRADGDLAALPDGAAWYQRLVGWHAGGSPGEIHAFGLAEVARLVELREGLLTAGGFDGGVDGMRAAITAQQDTRSSDPDRVLEAFRATAKRLDPVLPRAAGRLPAAPYGVKAMAAEAGVHAPMAAYREPGVDARRTGWLRVNLQREGLHAAVHAEALSAQYAAPGMHLAAALAAENAGLSPLRRYQTAGAHLRGWGLYAAGLDEELGLYRDFAAQLGRLELELEHALALVVDTGLHALGWERARAIGFLAEHLPREDAVLAAMVDRHLAWPGEASADALGAAQLRSLRARAEATLGDAFLLRDFHDAVLGDGQLPLDLLAANIDDWIAARLTNSHEGATP